MKIFISSDIEGTCGIAHWDETEKGKELYNRFAGQMTREVAAACEGAIEAGADEILVRDAHDSMRNLFPEQLPRRARVMRGSARNPYCMMAGLNESFDGVVFTGYHSAAGMNTNPLSHTMNLGVDIVTINGLICPELMINSLIAAHFGVPVYFVSGDKGLCDWMKGICPGTYAFPVSEGVGNGSIAMHPDEAVDGIRAGVRQALCLPKEKCLFPLPDQFHVELRFKSHDKATAGSWYPGCIQTGPYTVTYDSKDVMDVLRFFFWVM